MPGVTAWHFSLNSGECLKYFFCLCASVLLLACSGQSERDAIHITGSIMGTGYSVTVIEPVGRPFDKNVLAQGIAQELAHIDALMSTYKPDSEVSRLSNGSPYRHI